MIAQSPAYHDHPTYRLLLNLPDATSGFGAGRERALTEPSRASLQPRAVGDAASLGQGSDQKYGAYHVIFGVSPIKPVTVSVTLIAYGSRFHAVQPTHTSAL